MGEKLKRIGKVILTSLIVFFVFRYFLRSVDLVYSPRKPAKIFLYGETHARPEILRKELEIWKRY